MESTVTQDPLWLEAAKDDKNDLLQEDETGMTHNKMCFFHVLLLQNENKEVYTPFPWSLLTKIQFPQVKQRQDFGRRFSKVQDESLSKKIEFNINVPAEITKEMVQENGRNEVMRPSLMSQFYYSNNENDSFKPDNIRGQKD